MPRPDPGRRPGRYGAPMRVRTLVGPLLLVGAVAAARRRSRADGDDLWVPRPDVEPLRTAVPAAVGAADTTRSRPGSPRDRGAGTSVRMDLDRARAQQVEPVVEFLTYLQQRRGDGGHLLFVRHDDLDAMAASADEPVDAFLSRLDHLGVVVSHN